MTAAAVWENVRWWFTGASAVVQEYLVCPIAGHRLRSANYGVWFCSRCGHYKTPDGEGAL